MFTENNYIELAGVISEIPTFSHECFGEKFYSTKIKVKRDSGVIDEVPIMISNLEEMDIKEKYVLVKGTIRSHNEEGHVKTFVLVEEFKIEYCDTKNEVKLDGYICKKFPMRKTPNGRKICDVILVVNRPYGKSDYITCIFWNKRAEWVDKIDIGEKVNIEGRLQSRKYNKDGKENTTYEVSVK